MKEEKDENSRSRNVKKFGIFTELTKSNNYV